MIPPGNNSTPDPQLLAAYLDGEFEGRDGVEDLRCRVEAWLETDPSAQRMARDHRRLRQLWAESAAPEPSASVWEKARLRVQTRTPQQRPAARNSPFRARALLSGMSAFLLFVVLPSWFTTPTSTRVFPPVVVGSQWAAADLTEDDFVLPVATAEEVAILQVEGRDTGTLVVGQLPLQGLLELAGPEDVSITSIAAADDNMVPQVRFGGRSPLIWARAPTD